MKALIAASVATAALLASTAVFAQTNQPADNTQAPAEAARSTAQVAQSNGAAEQHHWYSFLHRDEGHDSRSNNDCVGPVSYCTIFFGS